MQGHGVTSVLHTEFISTFWWLGFDPWQVFIIFPFSTIPKPVLGTIHWHLGMISLQIQMTKVWNWPLTSICCWDVRINGTINDLHNLLGQQHRHELNRRLKRCIRLAAISIHSEMSAIHSSDSPLLWSSTLDSNSAVLLYGMHSHNTSLN